MCLLRTKLKTDQTAEIRGFAELVLKMSIKIKILTKMEMLIK